MKVKSEDLLPVVLDFIKESYGKDDLKAFKKHFGIKTKHKSDPLVKAGGLSEMLTTFFKYNKEAHQAFKKHHDIEDEEEKPAKKETVSGKKRKRADSDVSEV